METIAEILKTLGTSAMQAGLIASILGAVSGLYMLSRSIRHVKQSKATKLDALFLSYSSPGFSRYSIFNSPDTIGIGVYAALALEQVGAMKDVEPYVILNIQLYPDWPEAYLLAARYSALNGQTQKARDYLSIANTLLNGQKLNPNLPQLDMPIIEELIKLPTQALVNTTSLLTIYEELRDKPHLLIVARSLRLLLLSVGLLFIGILLFIVKALIS